ncbi:MAG: hypothetical protein AAFN07_06695 [Pseudomonadota bacterium]
MQVNIKALLVVLSAVSFFASNSALADDETVAVSNAETTVASSTADETPQLFKQASKSAAIVASRLLGFDFVTGANEAQAFANCNCTQQQVSVGIACGGPAAGSAACYQAKAALSACELYVETYCDLEVMN